MDTLTRLLKNIQSRVLLMIGRGVLKAVSDNANAQLCQVSLLDGELKSNVERVQNYGMTSVPPAGSLATVLFVGGDRSNGVIIAAENRKIRIKGLKAGEVAIYTDEGDEIYLKRGNEIALKTTKFVIDADEIQMNGAVNISKTLDVEQNITSKAEVADQKGNLSEIRSIFDAHTHTGNAGAPTSPPAQTMGG
jgi:phage baseplate assembly protein V|nr:MAG TPA: baseplate assembly protein V [Caudoviricetes sp.]